MISKIWGGPKSGIHNYVIPCFNIDMGPHFRPPIQKKRVIYRISKLHKSQDPRIWRSFRLAVEVVIGHVPRVEPQRL